MKMKNIYKPIIYFLVIFVLNISSYAADKNKPPQLTEGEKSKVQNKLSQQPDKSDDEEKSPFIVSPNQKNVITSEDIIKGSTLPAVKK